MAQNSSQGNSQDNPWQDPNSIWNTKAEYFTWLRGALRRIWSDYPLRKQWKKTALRPVTDEEKRQRVFHPSTKNVGQCFYCKQWMAGSKLEVDHITPSLGCYSYETAQDFLWHCAGLTSDCFQLCCKPCHKIKTHADKQGISFEKAKAEKRAIALQKTKEDKAFIENAGYDPESNATKRRAQIIDILTE